MVMEIKLSQIKSGGNRKQNQFNKNFLKVDFIARMYPAFYFVRHAESLHNERASQIKKSLGLGEKDSIAGNPQYLQVKYSPDYFDAGITKGGEEECLNSRNACQDLDIGLVIVSPLYRALKTCHETFKEHKNKPQVYVEPLLGERMTSSCDIGAKLKQSMKLFPNYNYEAITQSGLEDSWYIQNLPAQHRADIHEIIKQTKPQNAHEIGKIVLAQMQKHDFLQTKQELSMRVNSFKKRLVSYLSKTDKKIAIVGHSGLIQFLTATGFKEDGSPINGVFLANCEVRLVNLVMDGYLTETSKHVFCG